jgi:phage tail-like protein
MIAVITPAVGYACLRSGERWPNVVLAGLSPNPAGDLELTLVPAVSPAWLAQPAGLPPSGLATDDACGLYVADTGGNRVARVDLACGEQAILDCGGVVGPDLATVHTPAGLTIGPFGWLFIADPASGQILVFARPQLTLRDTWSAGLSAPVGLAGDDDLWLVVLDAGVHRILRFDPWGQPDPVFDAQLTGPSAPGDPRAIAIDREGVLYVADWLAAAVLRFDRQGQALNPIAPGVRGTALAVSSDVLAVADVTTGHILLFSVQDGQNLGEVTGFVGSATALTWDKSGRLYIKTGTDSSYVVAQPMAAHLATGSLIAGPLDAGERSIWKRLAVKAVTVPGTSLWLETATADAAAGPMNWTAEVSIDTLLPPQRFLWVRLTVETRDPYSSPRVLEVNAETSGDDYLDYLPAVYSRDAETADFFGRVLALAKTQLGDLEALVGSLPKLYDPAVAPADALPWLAGWEAFEVPDPLADGQHPDELRSLLNRLWQLYERRGTPAGLLDFLEIYTGVRPLIFEAFRWRGVWNLGVTSALGFDTMLPARAPGGYEVGGSPFGAAAPEDPNSWGSSLFADTAHRFTVIVPAASIPDPDRRRAIRRVLDNEKPAHTDYHLCFIEPRLRVGVQDRVGIDAIVAGRGPDLVLGEVATLGIDSRLADPPAGGAEVVGSRSRIGIDTRVGD